MYGYKIKYSLKNQILGYFSVFCMIYLMTMMPKLQSYSKITLTAFNIKDISNIIIHKQNKFDDNTIRECSQNDRIEHINKMCSSKSSQYLSNDDVTFLVDDEHKIAYCNIPKIASSTWKTILMTSTKQGRKMRKPSSAHNKTIILESGLRFTTDESDIANYTKFMITRNPIDRFISAYYDKMANNYTVHNKVNDYWIKIRKHILKFNRLYDPRGVPIVSFNNFIHYILHTNKYRSYKEDIHWTSYASLCQPCRIK